MQTQLRIKRALISVSDKTEIVGFALKLTQLGIEILATGGTAALLKKENIKLTDISDYTGFPEIMDGRVKTLHPKIAGGLLGRRGIDEAVMQQHNIEPIDLLVVNLYPFAKTIQKKDCSFDQAIEQIDIGGPTMLRAAAKNFPAVTTIIDPADYEIVLAEMQQNNTATSLALRQKLAQKVFAHTASYDQLIADYLLEQTQTSADEFPLNFQPQFKRELVLRYGENPHQTAAFYRSSETTTGSLGGAKLLQGKPLSYNNMIDADCALQCAQELDRKQNACVIVKHATPCGVAQDCDQLRSYERAFRCDPQSAFGGIIAFNQPLNKKTADEILRRQFVEVLLAPSIEDAALLSLKAKPNLRVLIYGELPDKNNSRLSLHSVSGGLLVQQNDCRIIGLSDLTVASKRQPTDAEIKDLLFAWQVVKFTKSHAIVYAKDQANLGIGNGQTSRVFAASIAALRAQAENLDLNNAVMASDAFFPFADGIETAQKFGITAVIQPGGSKRDNEVIKAADNANMAMVFTGIRHFRH